MGSTFDSDRGCFEEGLRLIREGAYWEAHEALEQIWKSAPAGPGREAIQALIQFAAAAYKIDQARDGRDPDSMRRGMAKLVESARSRLDEERAMVSWDVAALREALDHIDTVRDEWSGHGDADIAGQEARQVALSLVAALAESEPDVGD